MVILDGRGSWMDGGTIVMGCWQTDLTGQTWSFAIIYHATSTMKA